MKYKLLDIKLIQKKRRLLSYFFKIVITVFLLSSCSDRDKLISAFDDLPKLEKLIASGVKLDSRANESEMTALSIAITQKNNAVAKLLIDAGADPLLGLGVHNNALTFAISMGNVEIFKSILEKHPKLKENQEVLEGLISSAVISNHPEMIQLIPNGKILAANSTLLYACGSNPEKYNAKVALLEGANPNKLDSINENPFYHKNCYCNPELLNLAIQKGLNIENRNTAGKTILMVAAETAELDCVKIIIKAGATCDEKVFVHTEQEHYVTDTITSRKTLNHGSRTTVESKETSQRKLTDIIKIPILDFAKENDSELYKLLLAKKQKLGK